MKYETRIIEGTPKARGPKYLVSVIPVVLNLAAFVTFVLLVNAWLPRLPEEIATHWGLAGGPNDFQSPWMLVTTTGIISLVFVIVGLVVSLTAVKGDSFFRPVIWLNAFVIGMSIWLYVSMIGGVYVQLDRDPTEVMVTEIFIWMGIALVVAVLVALLFGYLAGNSADKYRKADTSTPVMELAENAKGYWISSVASSAIFRWFIYLMALALLVFAMFTLQEIWLTVILLLTFLVMVGAALSLHWNIVIDEKGLSAVSALGVWRMKVPIEKILTVGVAQIDPLQDFGGFGLRLNPSATMFGIVLKTGDAIVIERSDKKRKFVVTVEDASTGASLLAAYMKRRQENLK